MSMRESLIDPPFPDLQAPVPEAMPGSNLPDGPSIPWKRELLEVFLRNQLRLA